MFVIQLADIPGSPFKSCTEHQRCTVFSISSNLRVRYTGILVDDSLVSTYKERLFFCKAIVTTQHGASTLLTASNKQSPKITLPETNIAPESLGLEDEFPFGKAYFQVLC